MLFTGWIRAWLGRVVGAAVATFCVWLAAKTGIPVTEETQQSLADGITLIGVAAWYIIAAFFAKLTNNKFNPADSASSRQDDL